MAEFISVPDAAQRAGVTPASIRNWCRRYALGLKVAGRYRVDPVRLAELLAGEVTDAR